MGTYTDFLYARPSFAEGMARIMDFGNTLTEYNRSPDPDTMALVADPAMPLLRISTRRSSKSPRNRSRPKLAEDFVADENGEEEGQSPRVEIDPVPAEEDEAEAARARSRSSNQILPRLLRQEITIVRQELRQEIRQDIRAELHIGPLPHHETLAGYDRLVPGSAEKIIDAFV